MNEKQQELLVKYRELWVEYSSTVSLIDRLQERLRVRLTCKCGQITGRGWRLEGSNLAALINCS